MDNLTFAATTGVVITEQADLSRNGVVTLILICLFLGAAIFNVLLLVVFAGSRQLRSPPNYLLVSIAIADILSAFLWILPAVATSVTWTWLLGGRFCEFAGFAGTLAYGVNAFTLLAVTLEKFMKFWSPSRHKLAFTRVITLILVVALWIFALLFAAVPLFGWGNYAYVAPRLNCVLNLGLSYSLLDFYTVAGCCLPALIGLVFFALILGKVLSLRASSRSGAGDPILEERTDRIGESYGQKFQRQEEKYRNVANKANKPAVRKNSDNDVRPNVKDRTQRKKTQTTEDVSDYDASDDVDTDDDEYYTDYVDAIHKRRERERRLRQRRKYRLHRRDVSMTMTVFLVWAVFVLLWLPCVVLNYVWIYDFYPDFSSRTAHIVITMVAFVSAVYKPFVYLGNGRIRTLVKSTLKRRRTSGKPSQT